jgi:hypothetical protein
MATTTHVDYADITEKGDGRSATFTLEKGATAWMPGTTKYVYRAERDGASVTYRYTAEGPWADVYGVETDGMFRSSI